VRISNSRSGKAITSLSDTVGIALAVRSPKFSLGTVTWQVLGLTKGARILHVTRKSASDSARLAYDSLLIRVGDIDSTFASFRNQFAAGLNMGVAGIPWWTSDIGGFGGGDPDDPDYRELFIRWFQWGAFCPVFRVHGFRKDNNPQFALMHPAGSTSEDVYSGGPNEVWSYGDEAYVILSDYLFLRERLRPYIRGLMQAAHDKGTPVMRPLFYDFPRDPTAWEIADQFMFGPDLLVAPVMHAGLRERPVYLPLGACWKNARTGEVHVGGQTLTCTAGLADIPLYLRDNADLPVWRKP